MTQLFDRIRIVPRPDDFLYRNVGSNGEVFYDQQANTLRLYNGKLTGGTTVITSKNMPEELHTSGVATVKYTVTVGAAQGSDSGNKYYFADGTQTDMYKPVLNLVTGYTYIFDQSDRTNLYYPNFDIVNPHPLNFSADNANGELGGGSTYLEGVVYKINNDPVTKQEYWDKFNSATTRSVQITITDTTPTTLYYHCKNHTNMGNSISKSVPGGGGSASLTVSSSPPSTPGEGNLWYDNDTGFLYVYLKDGTSDQWVQPIAGNVFSGVYTDLVGVPTFATVANTGQYSDLTGQPSIPSTLTDLGITDGTVNQVLTTDGAGNFTFSSQGGFDQTLNTTDAVTFASVTSPSLLNTGTGVTNFNSSTSLTISATDGVFISNHVRTLENIINITGSASLVDHSLNLGTVFYHTGISPGQIWTANFTNVPTTNDKAITVVLIIDQASSLPVIPTFVQIDGVTQTVNYEGGSPPSGTANNTDVLTYNLIRTGGAWKVLGSLTTYG